jgi:RNA polymerase sigma-70 factor (ECF subfamily)
MPDHQQRDRVLKEAFACHSALVGYAYALLPDRARAEDAVQNAYLVITRKYDTFTLGTSVIAWCRSIVRLEVLQILRKHSREIATEDSLLFDSIADSFEKMDTPDREAIRSERRQNLAGCLKRLPERSRILVSGRYLEGHGLSALASGLNMTEAAVRKSIYRVRQALRQCMEEKEAPAS